MPDFKVDDKFVLVSLDYPQDSSKMSAELKDQNDQLQKQYKVEGFPTIYLMDEEGRPYARTGYHAGGPEGYTKHLDELLKIRVARDTILKEAEGIEDPKLAAQKKAEVLTKLRGIDVEGQYAELIQEVIKHDPDNYVLASSAFYKTLPGLMENSFSEPEAIIKAVDEFVSKYKPEGDELQEIEAVKLQAYMMLGDFEVLETQIQKIVEMNDTSEIGAQLKNLQQADLDEIKQEMVKINEARAAAQEEADRSTAEETDEKANQLEQEEINKEE